VVRGYSGTVAAVRGLILLYSSVSIRRRRKCVRCGVDLAAVFAYPPRLYSLGGMPTDALSDMPFVVQWLPAVMARRGASAGARPTRVYDMPRH
jgi:hypothetical protein